MIDRYLIRRLLSAATAIPAALLLFAPAGVFSASDLEETASSPDVTIAVDAGTLTAADEDVIVEDGALPALAMLGAVPGSADLSGYHLLDNGDQLFSLDTTVTLGALTASPRDVVSYDGASYSLAFDGVAEGVPNGARIDAITAAEHGDLVLSFDITVDLGTTVADDEDLVRFDPATGASLFLDGGAAPASIPSSLDVDGAHYIAANQNLLISFDGSGQLGGVNFDDEDVMEYNPAAGTWELSVDTAASEPEWVAADLNAFHAVRSCVSLSGDTDGDELCDDEDPCLTWPNPLPILDSNGDDIPNDCQCGDTNGDGFLTTTDAFAMVACGADPGCGQGPPVLALWDTNDDGFLTTTDAFNVVARSASGEEWRNTCTRRPEGTIP